MISLIVLEDKSNYFLPFARFDFFNKDKIAWYVWVSS